MEHRFSIGSLVSRKIKFEISHERQPRVARWVESKPRARIFKRDFLRNETTNEKISLFLSDSFLNFK